MNVIRPHAPMTEAEFLAWVLQHEFRFEFDRQRPVPMVGSSLVHLFIQSNLIFALRLALGSAPLWVGGSDSFTRVPGRLRLPGVVVCRDGWDPESRIIEDAIVVFEILPPDSRSRDLFEKAAEYWDVPSIRHYVVIEQEVRAAVIRSRGETEWVRSPVRYDDAIRLEAIGISIPLGKVYGRLAVPRESDAA